LVLLSHTHTSTAQEPPRTGTWHSPKNADEPANAPHGPKVPSSTLNTKPRKKISSEIAAEAEVRKDTTAAGSGAVSRPRSRKVNTLVSRAICCQKRPGRRSMIWPRSSDKAPTAAAYCIDAVSNDTFSGVMRFNPRSSAADGRFHTPQR